MVTSHPPSGKGPNRRPRRQMPRCPRPHCGGNLIMHRNGDYVTITCISCGRDTNDQYAPKNLGYEVRMPPQAFEPVPTTRTSKPRPKPKLETEEPQLTKELEKYCDLRRRGYTHEAIRNRTGWPRYYPNLLLEEAIRREMPGSNENANEAFREWLLETFDSAMDITAICRMSAQPEQKTRKKLKEALDADSGPRPEDPIIAGPDRQPARVSWNTSDGRLQHRPFDGPLPRSYSVRDAVNHCQQILLRLMKNPGRQARDRAYTMLMVAEAGWHTLDHDDGRKLYNAFADAGMDDDAKRTVILNLHEHPSVGQLLLDRCGISPRWLTGNRARFLSRRLREHQFPPAVIRTILEHIGNDPNAYYMIGVDYRIPELAPDDRDTCVHHLERLGFTSETIEGALGTLGVPPGGHHPPKRKPPSNT